MQQPFSETEEERQAAGQFVLARRKIRENLSFKVKQMAGLLYGRDYFLGDLVDATTLDYSQFFSDQLCFM